MCKCVKVVASNADVAKIIADTDVKLLKTLFHRFT